MKKDRKEEKIFHDYELTGDRAKLFEKMRELYPKGNPESQKSMCMEIGHDRVSYYIDNVFNFER